MNKQNGFAKITAVLAVVGLIAAVGIISALANNGSDSSSDKAMMENKSAQNLMADKTEQADDSMMKDEKASGEKMMADETEGSDAMMVKSGSYKVYSPAAVEAEQKAGNKVVLFFHAPWCPFCRAADSVFQSSTTEIPAGVTVLKTDYDSNTALKQKYGVTYQHTFVQIDNDENQVSKWNGGDIDNLKKYIK